MYQCKDCRADVEQIGGTQLNSCEHFLCSICLVKEANNCSTSRILCDSRQGPQKQCYGFMDIDELEYMIPDKEFSELLYRVSENAALEAGEASNQKFPSGSALLQGAQAKQPQSTSTHTSADEESVSGWDQKAALVHDLTQVCGMSPVHAYEYIDALPILENRKPMPCIICLDDSIPPGHGIILKDCCHEFCKQCLGNHVKAVNTSEVTCPYADGDYRCVEPLKPSEIKALVDPDEYKRHFEDLALSEAAKTMQDVFHCLTPDCKGFCVIGTDSRIFQCPICNARSCASCKVIHAGNCVEYWAEVENKEKDDANRVLQRKNEERSVQEINRRLHNRLWMRCPKCNSVIEKNGGCAHMKCKNCSHDFNWTGTV